MISPEPAVGRHGPPDQRRFIVRTSTAVLLIPMAEIDWIGAEGDYICIHAGPKKHFVRMTMGHAVRRLDPARFFRVHRSTIVNVDRIERLCLLEAGQHAVVLKDGTRLRLAVPYRRLLAEIASYA